MGLFDRFKSKPIEKNIGNTTSSGVGLQTVNWDALGKGTFNPDEVSVNLYKKISKDATVRSAYNLLKFSILSRNWKIISGKDDKKSQTIIDSLKYTFEHMDGRLDGSMSNVLTSVLYGFSVSEIVFDRFKVGKFSGKIGVKKIKGLDPETITFVTSRKGDLQKVLQSRVQDAFGAKPITLPLDRLIIHTNEKEFGNYYGSARLRSVYEHWFIKRVITRFWNIALERFGMPIVVGTVPAKSDLENMKSILSNLQSKSSIAKLDGWNVEALETGIGRSSGGDYQSCIDYHNSQILKAMLIPESLMGGSAGGSFAKSKVEFDMFQIMIRSLEKDLCGIIENSLIKPLVFFNYGQQENYPQFVFEPLTKAEFLELAKVFSLLVRNGVIGSEETWIRDMLKVPKYSEATIDPNMPRVDDGEGEKIKQPVERKKMEITQKNPDGGGKPVGGQTAKKQPAKPKGGTQQIKTPKQRTQSV